VRPPRFFGNIGNNERLLGLPHPAGRVVIDWQYQISGDLNGTSGLQNMKAHGAARHLVQNQSKNLKLDYLMEWAG